MDWRLEVVPILVSDVDRAKRFYGDQVGFSVDLAPVTPAGKLFTVFYLFTGIGLIVVFHNAVARAAVEQREENRGALGRRKRPPEDG